jgi:hypothetical protein
LQAAAANAVYSAGPPAAPKVLPTYVFSVLFRV